MSSRAEVPTSGADAVRFVVAGLLGLAGIVAFYVFAEQSLLLRTIGLLVVAGIVAFVLYQTALGKRTVAFFRDARTEVRKIVWPTRAETTQTTVTVVIIVILVGLFLWALDSILSALFRTVTGL